MPPRCRYRPQPPTPDPLLTLHDVALRLRCSKRTVQRWVKRGLLPAPFHPSPFKCLWRESDIQKFLDRLGNAATS